MNGDLLLTYVYFTRVIRKVKNFCHTWGVQVVRYPNFFSGMEADRNVKVVEGDVAVL